MGNWKLVKWYKVLAKLQFCNVLEDTTEWGARKRRKKGGTPLSCTVGITVYWRAWEKPTSHFRSQRIICQLLWHCRCFGGKSDHFRHAFETLDWYHVEPGSQPELLQWSSTPDVKDYGQDNLVPILFLRWKLQNTITSQPYNSVPVIISEEPSHTKLSMS